MSSQGTVRAQKAKETKMYEPGGEKKGMYWIALQG